MFLMNLSGMRKIAAKPFLKWAGGKTQLLGQLTPYLPQRVTRKKFTYVEPCVGAGAVFFWMLNTFPNMDKAIINDINEDLVNVYRIIASYPRELISVLSIFQDEYHALKEDREKRKAWYYEKRELYNTRSQEPVIQAALFISLNRTCFNGLYRVNSKNQFNVSFGMAVTPTICNKVNLMAVSEALQKVEIRCGDFERTLDHTVGDDTLLFIDPPYKPISKTSNFNAYTQGRFDDNEQTRLRDFCMRLHEKGCKWMLCNSDVKAYDPEDDFFDRLYANFNIHRLISKRTISANVGRRGSVCELLITNY